MTETTDTLTTIETTLRDVLAYIASARTGELARRHGWPAPDEAQCNAMTRIMVTALTELVRAMRDPQALAPSREELDEVLEGVALGVLEKVMGLPTRDSVH